MKTNAHAWDIPAQMGIHAFLALAKMDSRLRGNDPYKGAKPWCRSMKTKIPSCFAPTAAQRVGSLRAVAGNCLTEPGIVCFPVAAAQSAIRCPAGATGKHYEAREGVLAAPARSDPTRVRNATNPPRP
jgi:hypothetical protein